YEAAKMVRDAGFKRWDVYSPFPIHGMDDAMGLGKSWLSAVVLVGGITGLSTAAIVEFGPSSILYPVIVHGKPTNFFTVPALFPDMVRQMKVRAQAPLAFFADGRGSRLPVTGTVPIGYEMQKPDTIAPPPAPVDAPRSHSSISFSVGSDYYNTGTMGDHWGT